MERGSDKHGPRVDEEMAHEVEGLLRAGRSTHAEEWKDPEPAGEDQPDVDRDPGGTLVGGTPEGMTEQDVETRSELAQALGKEVYPATGGRLVEVARERAATDRVIDLLRRLPAQDSFQNVQEVWAALGGGTEQQRF